MPIMKLSPSVVESIVEHARKETPVEACGYLACSEEEGLIVHHYELTNLDRARDHFTMDPSEQFDAVRDMREKGLKLAAVYHSHPDTPARPSIEDIRLAYDPDISYVIISLAVPEEIVIRSFRIRDGKVVQENIEYAA